MTKKIRLQNEIRVLFKTELELDIPSMDTDLIESGYLDSLRFVQLLTALENLTDLKFDLEDLEIKHFTTIENLSDFIVSKMSLEAQSPYNTR